MTDLVAETTAVVGASEEPSAPDGVGGKDWSGDIVQLALFVSCRVDSWIADDAVDRDESERFVGFRDGPVAGRCPRRRFGLADQRQ